MLAKVRQVDPRALFDSQSRKLSNRRSLGDLGLWLGALFALAFGGCGTTKSYTATEQLLLSDAVDAAVSQIDFSLLSGRAVYLDTTYLKTVKGVALVDSDYVISSLRQQMVAAGIQLVEVRDQAELIAEARMGALGFDNHNVVYGIPANNISSASSAISGTSLLPALPEISFARREGRLGASKLAVFAYDRQSKLPYWQSGISQSTSDAKDVWVLGVGPFQSGTIHDGTRLVGADGVLDTSKEANERVRKSDAFADYVRERRYAKWRKDEDGQIITAGDPAAANAPPTDAGVTPASSSAPAQ